MPSLLESALKSTSLLAFILSGVLVTASAEAATVADQSLRDIGAAMNHLLSPQDLKSPQQSYLEAYCKNNIEGSRVRVAAIYGENNLDDLAKDSGVPNQCSADLGVDSPPTGRVFIVRNGQRYPVGSGDTVFKDDVVVTSAHIFYENGESRLAANDQVVFAVHEMVNGSCKQVDYSVQQIRVGTENPQKDPGNDFAVLKLSTPLKAYDPLDLSTEDLADRVKSGELPLVLMGFGNHESTGGGRDLSAVSCRGYAPPPYKSFSSSNNLFFHDCDTVKGMSGGAFRIITNAPVGYISTSGKPRKYTRYFLGVHASVKSSREGVDFDIDNEFSLGVGVNDKMRRMIYEVAGVNPDLIQAEL